MVDALERYPTDMEYVRCNLCGQDDPVLVYRKRGEAIPIVFNIVKCRRCGLAYVNPRLTLPYVRRFYDQNYYEGKGIDKYFVGDSAAKRRDARILVRCVRNAMLSRVGEPRLLEVGGGEGLVSQCARDMGFKVLMCDVSIDAVTRSRERGVPCYHGEISDPFFDKSRGSYDVIIALEVIEHLHDPMEFFAHVYQQLRPGGLFVYTTGNFHETRIFRSTWGYFNIPESHIYFFTPETIRSYFSKIGFTQCLDPYKFYVKDNFGTKMLGRIGIVDVEAHSRPERFMERLTYSHIYRAIETVLGRTRLPFAVK